MFYEPQPLLLLLCSKTVLQTVSQSLFMPTMVSSFINWLLKDDIRGWSTVLFKNSADSKETNCYKSCNMFCICCTLTVTTVAELRQQVQMGNDDSMKTQEV
jgi:hypothetical protein